MDTRDFKSGSYKKQIGYKSFLPEKINREWVVSNPRIKTLLEDSARKIGELNAYSIFLPDVDVFIRMHIAKEATTSSKIEGTQTNMEDAILNKSAVNPEKKDDWQEVQNYINAMNYSIRELKELPLSNRLLKKAHHILLSGVRGKHKLPGEFRRSQNWIGGATLTDAVFIPPHHSDLTELMSNLEKFLHNEDIHVPHLIRIAIAHYQFETIHPFLDGNGRLGRLMITLYLVSNNLLNKPSLYLSEFFEKNKEHYYNNLMMARTMNDLNHWLKFFLTGVLETAERSILTFERIIKLKNDIENKKIILMGKRSVLAKSFLNYLYAKPIISANELILELKITKPTANALVKEFVRRKIIKEQTGFKRNRIFVFEEYLNLFRK